MAYQHGELRPCLGFDDCCYHADGLDFGRGVHASQLERVDRDPCDVLHWGKLWLAALSVFAFTPSGLSGKGASPRLSKLSLPPKFIWKDEAVVVVKD